MALRDHVGKALGIGVLAGVNNAWTEGLRWGDVLFQFGGVFLVWMTGATVLERRRARRAEAEKDRHSDLVGDLGEFGQSGGCQGGGVEAG
jgi:hypothetical protein